MLRKAIYFTVICLLITGCTITPKPITMNERYTAVKKDLKTLFASQTIPEHTLNFPEALARGLKYNLDYRIKLVNSALQAGQLKVAMMTMLPALNVSASEYTRNNKYASSSITSSGQGTDVVSSTPNTIRSARAGLSWGILDFGVGYLKAQQQGERINIAEEEARKQLQQLSQDILVAYWSAYSAQQLMVEAHQFERILSSAKKRLTSALLDKSVPKESILNFEAAILDGNRHIIQLQYKYDKAMIDLKHMLNLPPGTKFVLNPPPLALQNIHNLANLNFEKLDAVTLVNRPELRGQEYQKRIAKLGVTTAIVQALPGITLNGGWNYNSNKYLLNKAWVDHSVDIAWNLLNIASLPFALETANTQVEYEKIKLMALTVTVLMETRYAYSHYESLRREYEVALKQTGNAQAILRLNLHRREASLASDQQVIAAKLRTLTSKMDENLLLSDLSTALGELYLSVGSDLLPTDINDRPLAEVTQLIQKSFVEQNTLDFKEYVNNKYNIIFSSMPKPTVTAYNNKKKQKPMMVKQPIVVNQPIVLNKKVIQDKKSSPTSKQYAVQLFGAYDLNSVKRFNKDLFINGPIRYGRTTFKGRDWYVLLYGNYDKGSLAKKDLEKLPRQAKTLSAWVRKTNDMVYVG